MNPKFLFLYFEGFPSATVVEKANRFRSSLLSITFTSLSSYLWLLRLCSRLLSEYSTKKQTSCLLYLAAAVSDFYVPTQNLPTHKIQSSQVAILLINFRCCCGILPGL